MTFARYLTGFLALTFGLASLGVGAWRLRRALVPSYTGALGRLAEIVIGLSTLVVVLEAVGAVGWYRPVVVIVGVPAAGLALATAAHVLDRRNGTAAVPPPMIAEPADPADSAEPSRVPGPGRVIVAVALLLAFVVGAQWVAHATTGLELGMRDLDSLRYHGPFAARWVQQHSIVHLQHTSAQNQETYFPSNTELVDGYGILLFGRDLLTPLRNIPWLAMAFLAAWCGGRRFGSGPAALAGVAAVCSTPLLASIEPGSAKNDIAALALVLAAVALALHALPRRGTPPLLAGLAVGGAAVGLAAGTKLTTIGPLLVICAATVVAAGIGYRWRTAGCLAAPALVTGGFWYGRNIAYSGTPFPWFRLPLGFVTMAGPEMPYDDRFGFSVMHYARSSSFWTATGVPGLQKSFGWTWPVLIVGAAVAVVLAVAVRSGRRSAAERLIGVTALAAFTAYLFTPWSAGGPPGRPHLFDLDLRFLAPALGLAAIAAARPRVARWTLAASIVVVATNQLDSAGRWPVAVAVPVLATAFLCAAVVVAGLALRHISALAASRRLAATGALAAAVVALGASGWTVQRDYLEDRYASHQADNPASLPMFRDLRDQRIAVGGFADDYPLFGQALTNHVQYVGVEGSDGLFRPVAGCREWLSRLRAGHYDYVVVGVSPAALHRAEPREEDWTERDRAAREVLHRGLTTVFRLEGRVDPASCSLPTAR